MSSLNTSQNLKEFLESSVKYDSVDEILEQYETQSEKGMVYERLWDLCIKLGFCPIFPNTVYVHKKGNSNNGKLKDLKNLNKYLTKNCVNSGNSGGCSDITLYNRLEEKFIFISSKYPKKQEDIKKQKSVSYYDIQNIISIIDDNKYVYTNYSIYLVVPDKKSVLEKVKNASDTSNHITKYMTESNILDKNDLQLCFLSLKADITKHMSNNVEIDYNEIYVMKKESLNLRFHQELITEKTSVLMEEGEKTFLWGCKCRSGKTYMIGGIILKQLKKKDKLNVLIITPAPTETAPQFTEDLFNKFKDFSPFKVIHLEGSKSIKKLELSDSNNIIVASKQLLQKYVGDNTIDKIKKLKLDIIGFDENHFSGTTDLSKAILDSYSSKYTSKIYLTATYNKPLSEWNIPDECQMYWDIEDEQICKSITVNEDNIMRLKDKHGDEYITKTLNYFVGKDLSIREIFSPYLVMPELHIMTNMFDQQRYEIIKGRLNAEHKIGFCFDTLFSLNGDKTRFRYEAEVKVILRYISGSQREEDGDKTIFTRISNICSTKSTREPFTHIWFLPSNNIDKTSKCLKTLMKQDSVLKFYTVMCVNRGNKDLAKDIKDEINKKEIEVVGKGRRGLILLAGNMLSLGITLDKCDSVLLMNNTLSSDKVLQQMYRCMTEGENKKIGFVIDLNISRVLNTMVNYGIHKKDYNIEDKMKYLIKNSMFNIDVDIMQNKKIDSEAIVVKLMAMWKKDPVNSFRTLLIRLDNDYEEFDSSTQRLINKTFSRANKGNIINATLRLKDEDDPVQEFPTGRSIIKDSDDNEDKDKYKDKKEDKEIHISFTKDVLPYVIPLTCILTMKDTNTDFMKMLNDIKDNSSLVETFDCQCLIWWNKKDLIDLIKDIIDKYFDKSSNAYNISVQFKMSLRSLIDSPKELLELISDCLKPKDVEKKQFGEVFTPMKLVEEMLDQLPKEVWTNKDLKWLDPASGMGNFPIAVYLRLMDSLKKVIKDDEKRKKHILENMLYMSELNKKNVLVSKQIFNIEDKYKLNIYDGDTLEFKPEETFNIKQFDIVMGNPPYNKGGIRSHTGKQLGEKNETIWPKFVIKSMEWLKPNGYLVFINPLSWLKKSHSVHELLLRKHIIWMKLWDNIKSLATINGKIPISLFVLKNVINHEKKETLIISEILSKKVVSVSNVYLNPNYSIPLAYHSIFNKLSKFIEDKDAKLEYKTTTVKSSGNKISLPSNYGLSDMLAVDTYTIKNGIMVKKALSVHPDADKRKIIIASKSSLSGIFIDEGKLSITGSDKFYIIGDKLNLIVRLFGFKISNLICNYTKYRQDFIGKDLFEYIPDIRKLDLEDITEKQFYKMIGLTKDEIKMIK